MLTGVRNGEMHVEKQVLAWLDRYREALEKYKPNFNGEGLHPYHSGCNITYAALHLTEHAGPASRKAARLPLACKRGVLSARM